MATDHLDQTGARVLERNTHLEGRAPGGSSPVSVDKCDRRKTEVRTFPERAGQVQRGGTGSDNDGAMAECSVAPPTPPQQWRHDHARDDEGRHHHCREVHEAEQVHPGVRDDRAEHGQDRTNHHDPGQIVEDGDGKAMSVERGREHDRDDQRRRGQPRPLRKKQQGDDDDGDRVRESVPHVEAVARGDEQEPNPTNPR